MASDNYLLVAAIDFGTTYSGYAFSTKHDFRTDPTQMSLVQWVAGSAGMVSQKASTCVLFKPDRTFHSFGYEAEDKYLNLTLDKDHEDWYLFRRFKMNLYNTKLDREVQLTDYSGEKKMPLIDVISATIAYLKSKLMKQCREQGTGVNDSEVRWVLTVPTIWTDPAKQLMREAAEKAGLDKRQLILCLEPEAASVFCKHIPVGKRVFGDRVEFQAGSKYMVIDAGGGTIDITVHKVQKDGHLREILVASGGDWGGTKVDEAFESYLEDIIGKQAFGQFKSDHLYDLLDLMRRFEVKKRLNKVKHSDKVTVSIPSSLLSTYNKLNPGQNIKENIAKNERFSSHVEFFGDKLRLSGTKTASLFDESIEQIVYHVSKLLRDPKVRGISAILMVGGYSECPLLLDAIRHIAGGVQLIVPNEAGLAVLKGAVVIGHSPSTISERICKFTYGVETHLPFKKRKHKNEYRVIDESGKKLCSFAFDRFVKKGNAVKFHEHAQARRYVPVTASQTSIVFSIYASNNEKPVYVTDANCQKIGEIKVDMPDTTRGLKRVVCVSMCFGGSEIDIKAVDEDTGQVVRASCDFLG
ncbi:heat shock 70 kDa protein 12B-like [Mizuhopecten yessoensis]|uniref:heat shock 70 kDa protein 12B-like n=1 Tax=Mizuhopecten yessoensis TaxID=6573 RepID=UPI000B45AF19|nr:heat shock 70 kDa protein 12B-like [Mizuhopecten yessoensis]XP_021367115.1 heat shock 70 kDa protein 12B-like [Mizuhopecten yessoensis]